MANAHSINIFFTRSIWIFAVFFSFKAFSLQMECPFGCGRRSDPAIIQVNRQVYICFKELEKQYRVNVADNNRIYHYARYNGPAVSFYSILSHSNLENAEVIHPRLFENFDFKMTTPEYFYKKESLSRHWSGGYFNLAVEELEQLTRYGLIVKCDSSKNSWQAEVALKRFGTGLIDNHVSGENYYSYSSYSSMLRFFESLTQDITQVYSACTNRSQRILRNNIRDIEEARSRNPDFSEYSDLGQAAPCYCSHLRDYTCTICKYREKLTQVETGKSRCAFLSDAMNVSLKIVDDARKNVLPLYFKLYDECINSHQFLFASYQRGLLHFHNGDFLAAWDDIQEFFEKFECSGETDHLPLSTLFDKGLVESELGLYNNAIASLSRVIEHDPDNKMAYFERAAAYFETGNFEAAFSDFLKADLHNTTTQISDLEYATAVLSGIKKGLLEGAREFLPSLLGSIKGMGAALWSTAVDDTTGLQALISNPSSYFNLFVSLLQQHVKDLSQKAKEISETYSLSDAVVELDQFAQKLMTKDPTELGEEVGFIIGKYGTDALAWYGVLKLPKALNFANKALTFEIGAESTAAREAIISQAVKKQAAKELISAESCAHRLVNAQKAIIKEEKLTKYALDLTNPAGHDKAVAFEKYLGFNQKNYKGLIAKIEEGVRINTPIFKGISKHGFHFQVDMVIEGPAGKGLVRTGWMYDPGSEIPRLTTVFAKKKL